MSLRRYHEKFTSQDGSSFVYVFPLNQFAAEQTQPFFVPRVSVTGANYEYNQLNRGLAVKANGFERVNFFAVNVSGTALDTEIDNLKSKLRRAEMGKLWLLDSAAARRWAYARLTDAPDLSLDVDSREFVPVSLVFTRFSDWYGETQVSQTQVISASSTTFTVTNSGNTPVYNAIFTLTGRFTNPKIANTTTGYTLESARDGSASGHKLRFNGETGRVEFSSDGGAVYTGDYANFVRQVGKRQGMVLNPGSNSFTVTVSETNPDASLNITFYPAFE